MPRCTNIECAVPVRWDAHLGDGFWAHTTTTRERKCPDSGLTPPFSQWRQRPAERSWNCPECHSWIPTVEDGHGRLSASCIGPALRPHPETSWTQPLPHAEPDAGAPEVRLSPDYRLVAIKGGDKHWRVSDGSQRPDQRVQDWQVIPTPRSEAEPAKPEPCDPEEIEYGIEYRYSPGRWHVLPNITFTDPVMAAKGVLQRNKAHGAEDYRMVQRKAAGSWEPVPVPVG